jgi:rubrerythrin
MRSRENDTTTQSTVRKALETVLFRTDDRTVIEECRRCGTTLESVSTCPSCGSSDIVEYRIQ